jgi:bifunctional DNA-binding transcriptional regulator/antitoxin component of YhaV-PrlF toxin-antitoxin module
MPQLVKGGKHVFGWSKVGEEGSIVIPSEAFEEYRLITGENVILMSGSKTSGGFGLVKRVSLRESQLSILLDKCPQLAEFRIPEGTVVEYEGRVYCWVTMCDERITVPVRTLSRYGIKPGDHLLAARGSGLALGFIVRGPIVEEARRHAELETYE